MITSYTNIYFFKQSKSLKNTQEINTANGQYNFIAVKMSFDHYG